MRLALVALSMLFFSCLSAQERVRRVAEARRDQVKNAKLDAISAVVKGQCVDGKTGKPLAGCTVKLRPWGRSTDDIPAVLKKPETVITGADGKFAIRVVAHESYQVGFDASFPGRWPRTGRWSHLLPGEVEDVGSVLLHPGVQALGKVVDQQGKPVSGVTVGINDLGLFLGSEDGKEIALQGLLRARPAGKRSRAMHSAANGVRWCTSGAGGKFFSKDSLPAGEFQLRINNRNVTLADTKSITIPEEGPMNPVTLVVQEEPFLGGIVVDETGEPVSRVGLRAVLKRSGRMASARTRADGTFKIYRAENSPDAVSIQISDPGPCERGAPTKEYAWGTTGIKIELRRALTIAIVVVEADTNKPVEEFAIRAYAIGGPSFSSLDRRMRLSGKHVEGKLDIRGMRRGKGRIAIIPKDPQLHHVVVDITAKQGMEPLRIELQRLQPIMVQVLDANGAPVKNANVFVIVPGNSKQFGNDRFNDPRGDSMASFSTDPTVTFDTLVHRSVTGGGGQCIAYGIGGRKDLVIAVRVGDGKLHRDTDIAFGDGGNGHTVQLKK